MLLLRPSGGRLLLLLCSFIVVVQFCSSADDINAPANGQPPASAKEELKVGEPINIGHKNSRFGENNDRPEGAANIEDRRQPELNNHNAAANAQELDASARKGPNRSFNSARSKQSRSDRLADRDECAEDIRKYCSGKVSNDDLVVLECLQDVSDRDDALTPSCHNLLWEFKVNLTLDDRFRQAAEEFCKEELTQNKECQAAGKRRGHLISCLSDAKDRMPDGHCKKMLTRMETILFTDFRLVGPFVEKCREDVKRFQCGQLDDDEDDKKSPADQNAIQQTKKAKHSQGATLECLLRKLLETGNSQHLDPQCRHEIIRIAELQAEDFHLDRPLFFACREDREKFCREVSAGEGRVFQCLYDHRLEPTMSFKCREELDIRLQLMGQDYKLSRQFVKACQEDIEALNCEMRNKSPDVPEYFHLSYMILCLEHSARAGSKIKGECHNQLFEHRRILMSDYRMDPEIVLTCSSDIKKYCQSKLEDGGRTLHCLMNAVRMQSQQFNDPSQMMDPRCKLAISKLMQAADVGSDYRVDRVLYSDCRRLIDDVCQKQSTSASDVLSCLMANVESPLMTEECENRLLEVQYFLSRDFTLDPQLHQACKQDADEKCGAGEENWAAVVPPPPINAQQNLADDKKQQGPERGYLVLTCLYRHAYDEDETSKLSPVCTREVQRVMRERAISVKLLPQIEDACLKDLAEKCSQRTGIGEEMQCLQENLKTLEEPCRKQVEEFAQEEAVDTRLNQAVMRACGAVLEKHCKDVIGREIDHGDIIECLSKNKGVPAMTNKCRTYVNHYELLSLKDYHFTYKFRQSCKSDIERFCTKSDSAVDKASIVRCLSGVAVDHALFNEQDQLSKECRKQLRVEYFSLESLLSKLGDEKLASVCESDLRKSCNEASNLEQALECLRERKRDLEPICRKYIFRKERLEFEDNTFDLKLNKVCSDEIRTLCSDVPRERVLHCLKTRFRRPGAEVSMECLQLVQKRQREQSSDIRLQPTLLNACRDELKQLCSREIDSLKNAEGTEAQGIVISCLRKHATSNRGYAVSIGCQNEVKQIIYASEVDPTVDEVFYRSCKTEIIAKCSDRLLLKEGHQSLMDCIKFHFTKHTINNPDCKKEIARKVNEELADIHLDPELNMACATDLEHYCQEVKPGDGKLLQCLLAASKSSNARLSQQCHTKLSDRESLWRMISQDSKEPNLPNNVGEVVKAMYVSPVRNTLVTVLLVIIAIIFAFGLCCGRMTRRLRREIKNR